MAGLKSLAKDTAIYGLSSIVGRFLNYLLVPLYTAVIPAVSGGYGVVSNVYAYTALILVLLTFGMETGFFRFANKTDADPKHVYANALLFVGGLSLLFVALCLAFIHPLSAFLEYPDHPDYIAMMVIVVALDSFQCIPFAYLRYQKKPMKFAAIKLFNIIGNIVLNLFFLLLCPYIYKVSPETINWFYRPDYLVGYIFVSNLIMSAVQMFFFIPELRGFSYRLDRPLMKQMVSYSFPILIFGLVGILNQTVDKMIYPFLFDDRQEGLVQLGIYSATSKVAMVMAMFTQAFRYAYEPFVFGKNKEGDNREMYAKAMKYFFIFSLLAFLAVMFYMDILRYLIAPDYWEGLGVVAIVMGAEILKGIYFNLSFWYKGSAIRLCGFRLGFGSRIRAYHPAFLCDRTKEIPRSLSVERHDGLSGFCRCIVHYCAGNDNYKHYLATGVSYPFVVVLCGLYRKKRLVEGVENKKLRSCFEFIVR